MNTPVINHYGCIYYLRSPSGKFYIGQTTQDFYFYVRYTYILKDGNGRPRISNTIKKYGIDSFEINVLVYCFSKEDLDKAEIAFIQEFNSIKCGYNLTDGGRTYTRTDDIKENIRQSLLNKEFIPLSDEDIKLKINDLIKRKRDKVELNKLKPGYRNTITKEHEQTLRDSRSKFIYTIKYKHTSEIFVVKHIRQFCEERGINAGHITHRGKSNGYLVLSKELKCTL